MNIKQKEKRFPVCLFLFTLLYLFLAVILYWIVKDNWAEVAVKTHSVSMGYLLPAGGEVSQSVQVDMDRLESVTFVPHFDQQRTGNVTIALFDGEKSLWKKEVPAEEIVSDQENTVKIDPHLSGIEGLLTLEIDPNETGMALWAGSTVNAGKFNVSVQTGGLAVNEVPWEGTLVMYAEGRDLLQADCLFWPVALVLLAAVLGIIILTRTQLKSGKHTILTLVVTVYKQYRYLLKQLIERDFRVKYKSSMLGMVWSLLNPLLTMLVYLFVFSTIFKSDIKNFPVYLMSGIVLFTYFSESSNLGMASIVGNSALITKVYMPKLIYPLSKILSAAINFCISLIPLFIVMLITGVTVHKSILLLPVVILFLIVFTFGISLILATMNVFFRDTQFLWSVMLTMMNFLTPIFYPESIIPAEFLTLYRMNPMYQIISFMRTIIIDGISPPPMVYLHCILASGITLMLGLWIFRKNQDRFVLYL